MSPSLRAGLLWWTAATLLLVAGLLVFVFLAARTIQGDADAVRDTRVALTVWARTVLLKGLLPQLWLALALLPVLGRVAPLGAGWRGLSLRVLCATLAAGMLVAATLLRWELPELPAVVFRDAWNFVATVLEMSAAVFLAALLPRLLLPGLRPAAQPGDALDRARV